MGTALVGGLIRTFARPQVRRRLAGAAGEDVEEVDDVLVFWEDCVVVEVDVAARCALGAGENAEEVDHVLVFGKDAVVVEVDGVAACGWVDEGVGHESLSGEHVSRGCVLVEEDVEGRAFLELGVVAPERHFQQVNAVARRERRG